MSANVGPTPANRAPRLLIVGAGPGTSHATAARFGAEGYEVILIGRNADRLKARAAALEALGVPTLTFQGDADDAASLRRAVEAARHEGGPISAVLFTAAGFGSIRDVLTSNPTDTTHVFTTAVGGLITTVQSTLEDLRHAEGAAVLVVNAGVAASTELSDALSIDLDVDGLSLASAAKSRLTSLLRSRLQEEGVYVGELVVDGAIADPARIAAGSPTIEPAVIANRLWTMVEQRTERQVWLRPPTPGPPSS